MQGAGELLQFKRFRGAGSGWRFGVVLTLSVLLHGALLLCSGPADQGQRTEQRFYVEVGLVESAETDASADLARAGNAATASVAAIPKPSPAKTARPEALPQQITAKLPEPQAEPVATHAEPAAEVSELAAEFSEPQQPVQKAVVAAADEASLEEVAPAAEEVNDSRPAPASANAVAGGYRTLPQPLSSGNRAPVYPALALRRGWQGEVLLQVLVSKLGRVARIDIDRSSGHHLLDKSAIKAVRSWRFLPGRLDDLEIEAMVNIPVRFELEEG